MATRLRGDWACPVAAEVGSLEFRAIGKDGTTLTGYAAVFDSPSSPDLGYIETIRPGAFNRSLKSGRAVALVLNHDDELLLASTHSKRLSLVEDQRGLHVTARLPSTSYATDLRALYDSGEVRGMSFSFMATANGVEMTPRGRTLTDVRLGHVSVLTTADPAYAATTNSVAIRSLADRLAADPVDLDELLDGIRVGRTLSDPETALLVRLGDHFRSASSASSPAHWRAVLAAKGLG